MEKPQKTAEDEEFEREYERMMADAFRTPSTASGPSMDMSVPSNIRQKYSRNISFGLFFYEICLNCYPLSLKKPGVYERIAQLDVRLD